MIGRNNNEKGFSEDGSLSESLFAFLFLDFQDFMEPGFVSEFGIKSMVFQIPIIERERPVEDILGVIEGFFIHTAGNRPD
jgi:hypothetical protein